MDIHTFRSWFDAQFHALLAEKINTFSSHSKSEEVASIAAYAQTLAQKGKRFRPFLAYTASGLSPEEGKQHFLLFASLELLHLFALIHDDIMDKAETRHDVLCAHRAFTERYGASVAEGVAILLGDIVLVWAYDCLFDYSAQHPATRDDIIRQFKLLLSEVTHGQILDVLSPVQPPLDRDLIEQKMILKTGRYSFVQPLLIGAIVSGATAEKKIFAEQFGLSLGIAFQLQDDILDFGSTEQTGKTSCTDMSARQQTFLSWFMLNEADTALREQFLQYFGKEQLSEEEKETIRTIMRDSGAFDYVKGRIDHHIAQAHAALLTYGKDEEVWKGVIELVVSRKK